MDNTLLPRQFYVSLWLLVSLLFCWLNRSRLTAVFHSALIALGAFVLLNLISVTAAINPVESWATISRYAMGLGFLAVTASLLHSRLLSVKALVQSVVIFSGIAAVITLGSIFKTMGEGDFIENIYNIRGTFSHKNLLSSALMLSFPFALMGSVILEKGWRKLSFFLLFLLIAEMFMLRTRGVWVSVLIAGGVSFFAFMIFRKPLKFDVRLPLKWLGLGVGLALGILVVLFSATDLRENVGDRSNLDKRLAFWNNSVEMFQEHPIIGVGPGNWKINFPKYGLITPEARTYRLDNSVYQGLTHIQRPHNDYLWVLTEGGILALLAFLAIFVLSFLQLSRNFKTIENREELLIDLALLFGLLAYMSFSFTDFPLERSSHLVLMLTLVSLVFRHKLSSRTISTSTFILGVLILGGFSTVVSYYRLQGEKHSVEVLDANARRNARKIIPEAEAAINAFYNMDNFSNPLPYYSSLGKLALQQNDAALEDALYAYDLHPYNIIVLNQLGNVYKLRGELDKALEYYTRATDISMTMETAQISKAEIYLRRRDAVNAMHSLNKINYRSQNPRYHQLLSQALPALEATRGQHNKFENLMRELQKRNPQRPEEYVQAYLDMRGNS